MDVRSIVFMTFSLLVLSSLVNPEKYSRKSSEIFPTVFPLYNFKNSDLVLVFPIANLTLFLTSFLNQILTYEDISTVVLVRLSINEVQTASNNISNVRRLNPNGPFAVGIFLIVQTKSKDNKNTLLRFLMPRKPKLLPLLRRDEDYFFFVAESRFEAKAVINLNHRK